jgi:integrase
VALAEIIRTPRLASKAPTVQAAADALLEGMRTGNVRTRSGDAYKPSLARAYKASLNRYLLPKLGGLRLDQVQRDDVQSIIDAVLAGGAKPSTASNIVMPLRLIYRRALRDGNVSTSPCLHLELPAVRGKRDKIVGADEAAKLISVLEPRDRVLWATAFYAGLRLGELQALRWRDVDLAAGLIRVEHGWDPKEARLQAPKSRAGVRSVIIVAALRSLLAKHAFQNPCDPDRFVFQAPTGRVFDSSTVAKRTRRAWSAAGLDWIGFHEARHTCASMFIAAGVNAKALSEMMGHSSIAITYDIYGHLMPGSFAEARGLVDAYLERALL